MAESIQVQCYSNIFSKQIGYNLKNREMYDLLNYDNQENALEQFPDGSAYDIGESYIDFSEELYAELISIDSSESAGAFFTAHPSLRFYFNRWKNDSGLISKEEYLKNVADEIEVFHEYSEIYSCMVKYEQDKSNTEVWDALASLLGKSKITGYLCDAEGEYYCRAYYQAPSEEATEYVQLEIEYLPQHMQEYLEEKLNNVTTGVSLTNLCVILRYKTLISAMYHAFLLTLFNEDTYRMCAHKNCHVYFKVNKSHPQTRCPKHIAARQRKRANQRKYQKEIDDQLMTGLK